MSRESDPQEWLRYAEIDRRSAKHLLEAGEYETCAFHCQQAVEKQLKAIVVKQTGERPPHVHDLFTLRRKIKDVETIDKIKELIVDIDSYYVSTRYPVEVVDPETFIRPLAQSAIEKWTGCLNGFRRNSTPKTHRDLSCGCSATLPRRTSDSFRLVC
ncbi:MAG: HEPN domain-containing protein [Chloroflexota bacterium]